MKTIAFATVSLVASVASAEPRHILVLHSDGTADAATRAKVDAEVLKLARNIDGTVEAGDIDLADAAAAVGCNPTDASCRDDVLATMSADELVVTTVNTGAGGALDISVRRITKGAPPHNASAAVPGGQPAEPRIDAGVGPLFGLAATALPVATEPTTPPTTPTTPTEPTTPTTPTTPPTTPTTPTDGTTPPVTGVQNLQDDAAYSHRHRVELGVIAGGGALALVGVLLWGAAAGTENDIQNAPTKTPTDFKNLQNLESKGDGQATFGNIFVVAGLASAGIAGFFLWRDHRDHDSRHAAIAPIVLDHGAGIAVTFGGAP